MASFEHFSVFYGVLPVSKKVNEVHPAPTKTSGIQIAVLKIVLTSSTSQNT